MPPRKPSKKSAKKNSSSLALQDNLSHPIQTMYHLLVMMGVVKEKGDLVTRYQGVNYNVSIAIPLIKYAIAFDGDETKGLEEEGWHIEHVAYRDVEPFSRVFFAIDNARVAEMYSRADPNVKTTSIPEEKLLIEFKRRRMAEPDRNYKFTRDDGTELTTPDFTWEEYRIVFFMDGAYWHSVKDDQALIKEIKSSKKMQDTIVNKRKDKVRKDGAIRSELSARGWTVLSCTDDDIDTVQGLKDVVDMVERAMQTIASVRTVVSEQGSISKEEAESIMGILQEDTPNMPVESPETGQQVDDASIAPPMDANAAIDNTGTRSDAVAESDPSTSIIDIINALAEDDDENENYGSEDEDLDYEEM